jgi:hypothetical protein
MSSSVFITVLIIGFLVWVISRLNSNNNESGVRNIIANDYLRLVTDAATRKELLEEIEETVEDFIKIDGRSRLEAERLTLGDLIKVAVICYTSPDFNGPLAYDRLRLCIAECFPQHLNFLAAYQRQVIRR